MSTSRKRLAMAALGLLAMGSASGCDPQRLWPVNPRLETPQPVQCEHWTPDNNATCD